MLLSLLGFAMLYVRCYECLALFHSYVHDTCTCW